jgi:hypothetical protein
VSRKDDAKEIRKNRADCDSSHWCFVTIIWNNQLLEENQDRTAQILLIIHTG